MNLVTLESKSKDDLLEFIDGLENKCLQLQDEVSELERKLKIRDLTIERLVMSDWDMENQAELQSDIRKQGGH